MGGWKEDSAFVPVLYPHQILQMFNVQTDKCSNKQQVFTEQQELWRLKDTPTPLKINVMILIIILLLFHFRKVSESCLEFHLEKKTLVKLERSARPVSGKRSFLLILHFKKILSKPLLK